LDPLAKLILNALKCPICQSRLDLLDWKDHIPGPKYNFTCSSNWEHYRIFFVHWEPVCRVEYETVIVYEGKHQYRITQYGMPDRTEIFIHDVDAENRIIDNRSKTNNKFSYEKKLFDFANTTREKVVNRVRTILVFS